MGDCNWLLTVIRLCKILHKQIEFIGEEDCSLHSSEGRVSESLSEDKLILSWIQSIGKICVSDY